MDIKNAEQVKELLKRKDNIDSFMQLVEDNPDCSLLISAKAENSKGRFVFLDKDAMEDAKVILFAMGNRIEEQLRNL